MTVHIGVWSPQQNLRQIDPITDNETSLQVFWAEGQDTWAQRNQDWWSAWRKRNNDVQTRNATCKSNFPLWNSWINCVVSFYQKQHWVQPRLETETNYLECFPPFRKLLNNTPQSSFCGYLICYTENLTQLFWFQSLCLFRSWNEMSSFQSASLYFVKAEVDRLRLAAQVSKRWRCFKWRFRKFAKYTQVLWLLHGASLSQASGNARASVGYARASVEGPCRAAAPAGKICKSLEMPLWIQVGGRRSDKAGLDEAIAEEGNIHPASLINHTHVQLQKRFSSWTIQTTAQLESLLTQMFGLYLSTPS